MAISAQDAMVQLLKNNANVASVVSTRVFPEYAQQGMRMPYITVTPIGNTHVHHLQGASGVAMPTLQVDGFAATKTQVEQLKDYIRLATDGFVGSVTVNSISFTFNKIFLASDNDSFVDPSFDDETGVRRTSMDFECAHNETIPSFA